MASQTYNSTLKLDSNNQETKEKLSLISDLITAPEPIAVARKTEIQHPDAESLAQNNSKPVVASLEPFKRDTDRRILVAMNTAN